jgi:hypothetical protein
MVLITNLQCIQQQVFQSDFHQFCNVNFHGNEHWIMHFFNTQPLGSR